MRIMDGKLATFETVHWLENLLSLKSTLKIFVFSLPIFELFSLRGVPLLFGLLHTQLVGTRFKKYDIKCVGNHRVKLIEVACTFIFCHMSAMNVQ